MSSAVVDESAGADGRSENTQCDLTEEKEKAYSTASVYAQFEGSEIFDSRLSC